MRKIYKILFGIIIFLIMGLIGYSYLNVFGIQIDGVNQITSKSLVTITKSTFPRDESEEYVLNSKQIERLKELITETKFTRVIGSSVYYYDNERYDIVVNNNNQSLSFTSLGGEYISVFYQFKGKYLKIKNPEWKETLEEIILLSK